MIKIQIDKNSINSISAMKKKIQNFKTKLKVLNNEFLIESIDYIIKKANKYLEDSSSYENTTGIEKSWKINSLGNQSYMIENDSPFSALVEFGTGIVGGQMPHDLAQVTGYKYGKKEWTFIRDLTSNEFIVNYPYTVKDVVENPDRYLMIENFAGYRGKSYLYNAIFDFFELEEYIVIYEKIFDKYMKKVIK